MPIYKGSWQGCDLMFLPWTEVNKSGCYLLSQDKFHVLSFLITVCIFITTMYWLMVWSLKHNELVELFQNICVKYCFTCMLFWCCSLGSRSVPTPHHLSWLCVQQPFSVTSCDKSVKINSWIKLLYQRLLR